MIDSGLHDRSGGVWRVRKDADGEHVLVTVELLDGGGFGFALPTAALLESGALQLAGSPPFRRWVYTVQWPAERRQMLGQPPAFVPLAVTPRTRWCRLERIEQRPGGRFWTYATRVLLTPVTVVLDLPLVLFVMWLQSDDE
jgi:hypothetical protein